MPDGLSAASGIATVHAPPAVPGRWRRTSTWALGLFGSAFVAGALTAVALVLIDSRATGRIVGPIGFGSATLLFLAGAVVAVVALVQMAASAGPVGVAWPSVVTLFPLLGGAAMTLFGAVITLFSTANFTRGRQLRRFGKVLLPPIADEQAWASLELRLDVPDAQRPALAAQWRENGRTEHASVAAFARLTLDLMALGAPPRLLDDASRDARDELRHTELCFSLARALDGRALGPGAFPEAQRARTLPSNRRLALAQLAVDSLVDGALHEGLSARVIARLVKRCEEPATRAVLKELAADEGRHAAHGWDVVAWCLAEGGEGVAHALLGALEALPQAMDTAAAAARDGGWERFGLHGAALEAEELARCRADLVKRVRALVATALPKAA